MCVCVCVCLIFYILVNDVFLTDRIFSFSSFSFDTPSHPQFKQLVSLNSLPHWKNVTRWERETQCVFLFFGLKNPVVPWGSITSESKTSFPWLPKGKTSPTQTCIEYGERLRKWAEKLWGWKEDVWTRKGSCSQEWGLSRSRTPVRGISKCPRAHWAWSLCPCHPGTLLVAFPIGN